MFAACLYGDGPVIQRLRHLHRRELGFLGLIGATGLLIALHLGAGLSLVGAEGSGWRTLDRQALERRVETGDLSDHEADWYAPADSARHGDGASRGNP